MRWKKGKAWLCLVAAAKCKGSAKRRVWRLNIERKLHAPVFPVLAVIIRVDLTSTSR